MNCWKLSYNLCRRFFVFSGPVEDNMKAFLKALLDMYPNTKYFRGCYKEDMDILYHILDCVIIPYKK